MTEQTTIMKAISEFEALGSARLSIMELVKNDLEGIDKQKKDVKALISKEIKSLADVSLATSTCNLLAPSEKGADELTRKRISRRRNFLKSILSTEYPQYDFDVTRGQKGGKIEATFIGDDADREANGLFQSVKEVFTYLTLEIPGEVTRSSIAMAVRNTTLSQVVDKVTPTLYTIDYSAIISRAEGLQATISTVTESAKIPEVAQKSRKKEKVVNA